MKNGRCKNDVTVVCSSDCAPATTNVSKDVGKMKPNRDGKEKKRKKRREKITEKRQRPQLASFYIQIT